ncbi:MAG: hydrogenase expression/synthesis, HypA [Planctomycetaceae bacterium]|nr:hydrogenase expression/synthesis, HypA [Planctomycetaceae bacterium]
MHELSIALSILDIVEEEAERLGATRVTAVHLKIGLLSGIVPEALQSAFDLIKEGTSFAAAQLVIQELPIIINCPTCAAERPIESIQNFICQTCSTPCNDVVSGRQLEVSALEIEAS